MTREMIWLLPSYLWQLLEALWNPATFAFLAFCGVWYRLAHLGRQVATLEERTTQDYQTGLRSGRLFDFDAAMLTRSSARIAVLLVDLDNFRRYNERGYREAGDRALQLAAQVLAENLVRAADRLYRMHNAGDEFLVLLVVENFDEAYRQGERLQKALEQAGVRGSVGIAYADPDRPDTERHNRRTPARLLALAATNKDVAKKRGGNCVWPPPDPPKSPPPVVAVSPVVASDWEKTEAIHIDPPAGAVRR